MTYFISGHLDLTIEEWKDHYEDAIHKAFREGADFVVGDAKGADSMAQHFLLTLPLHVSVRVYHMFDEPRINAAPWRFGTRGGFTSDDERDTAMTSASDRDIAWVRPGRESSGTAKNIQRRSA